VDVSLPGHGRLDDGVQNVSPTKILPFVTISAPNRLKATTTEAGSSGHLCRPVGLLTQSTAMYLGSRKPKPDGSRRDYGTRFLSWASAPRGTEFFVATPWACDFLLISAPI
jgi:hypothetical protein